MTRPDWSANDEPIWPAGVYAVEVTACVSKNAKKTGDEYFGVKLCALDFNRKKLCEDILMMAGKGAGIGIRKLKALGFTKADGDIAAAQLIGKRAFVFVDVEEFTKDDGTSTSRMKVDIKAENSEAGYWPEFPAPEGVELRKPKAGDPNTFDNPAEDPFDVF